MDHLDKASNEELPSILKDLKKKNSGYKIPVNYFANMQRDVLDRVIEPETQRQIDWLDNLKFLFLHKYKVATVTAVALVGFLVLFDSGDISLNGQSAFSDLGETELEYFLENDLDSWENQDLMAVLSEEEININDLAIPIASETTANDVPDQYIEDLDDLFLVEFDVED